MKLADAEVDAWEKQWAPPEGTVATESAAASDADKQQEPALADKPKEIPASAEMLFRRVLQLQQNDSRSMFFIGLYYIQRGAIQQGLTMLNRVAPLDRSSWARRAFLESSTRSLG